MGWLRDGTGGCCVFRGLSLVGFYRFDGAEEVSEGTMSDTPETMVLHKSAPRRANDRGHDTEGVASMPDQFITDPDVLLYLAENAGVSDPEFHPDADPDNLVSLWNAGLHGAALSGVWGLCGCGCGETTPLAPYGSAPARWVKGKPIYRAKGHSGRTAVFKWMAARPNGCIEWLGATDAAGYGFIRRGSVQLRAHRWTYETVHGPIDDGLVIDHLCRFTACVNPQHLEPVTVAENTRRGESSSITPLQASIVRRNEGALRQADFAVLLGVAQSTIARIQSGEAWGND